jgi:hypothetical protein
MKMAPELKAAVKKAEQQGWTLTITGKGHPRLLPPPGQLDPYRGGLQAGITFACSAGDVRSTRNTLGDFRRAGIRL